MNEDYKFISDFLTDNSILQFKDGSEIRGADEVAKHLLRCCEEYNKGYLEGKSNVLAVFTGAMILGGTIGVVSVISAKKIIKKLNSRKEISK